MNISVQTNFVIITQSVIGKTILILFNTADIFLDLFLLKSGNVGRMAEITNPARTLKIQRMQYKNL
jgi:hypothetical protein